MPDYDLTGLSTRSFEQLIQAIAAKVIGQNIVVFGDGRDGGREATFEGPIPYPSTTDSWNGYGVVQAKFKQRLQDSKKDGEWALGQLHTELQDFCDAGKNRRKPDYYVFATNVVLTPFPELGSKDLVREVFADFEAVLPLKNYAIWDYDWIRAFLDGDEDIRKGYAAWITPGDVLAQVMEWFEPDRADFEQTITSFLQKELLADQYANLEQAGHTSEDRVPIAQVFVDLPAFDKYLVDAPAEEVKEGRLPSGFLATIANSAAEKLDPLTLSATVSENRPDIPKVASAGRYVLIGGPGQGKTTVAQFICQLFRSAILKERRPQWVIDPEAKEVIRSIDLHCKNEGITLPGARRFPIRIVLSQFAKALASDQTPHINSLLSYAVDLIQKKTDQEVSANDFRRWLRIYPWTLVLDGLDEVPASSNRDAVLGAIKDFQIDARSQNADILIIATTRPQGYNEDFNPTFYIHTWLAPLSTPRAMHYATRLCEVRYAGDRDRQTKIIQRLTRASSNESTVRLMRSPLQVTIMTTLVDRMGQPPQERWNLFKEYYKVIYQRELERDIPAATILRDYQPDVDMIHNHVGLLLQVESERSGQTDARLSVNQFETVVESRLLEEGHEGRNFENLKRQIIEAATDRLVFLVGLQANEVGFEIRSLQEFMAAEALMDGGDELIRKRLRRIAPISNWRNVFLFAAGKCFAERQHLRDTIHAICGELNEDSEDGVVRETLAGSQLALDLLEDGPARRQPKYTQALSRLALRLLDLPPRERQKRLADLFEANVEDVYRSEIEQGLSHIEEERRLGAWTCLIPLIETGLPWAISAGDKFWPKEHDRQLEIFLTTRDSIGDWLLGKLMEAVPNISPANLEYHLRIRHDMYNKENVPPWFGPAMKLLDGSVSTKSVRLTSDGFKDVHLSFGSLDSEDTLFPIKDMPNPSSEWRAVIAAIKFVQNPSSVSLATAVEEIISQNKPDLTRFISRRFPWPLGWLASISELVRRDIATRIGAGDLGEASDWTAAELRWDKEGIDLNDLAYTVQHFPFDANVGAKGAPIARSWGTDVKGLTNLLALYEQVKGTPLAREVAWAILFEPIRERITSPSPIVDQLPTLAQLKDVFSDIARTDTAVMLDILSLYTFKEQLDSEFMEFLDWLGQLKIDLWVFRLRDSSFSSTLQETIAKYPQREGSFRVLAAFLTRAAPRFVNRSNKERSVQEVISEAKTVVEFVLSDWERARIATLAKSIAKCVVNGPDHEILKSAWDRHAANSRSEADEMILEVHKQLAQKNWQAREGVLQVLDDSLRRRTSDLQDIQIWNALGLPVKLRKALEA
jgi:hypothetical protein